MLTWWAQAEAWISVPWITIAFLVAGCLLLFHDLLTPLTWGVTGTLGLICIVLVLLAHAVSGLGVAILLGGVALLLIETHLLPGRGMAALFGFGLIFTGMFLSLFKSTGQANAGFALGTAAVVTFLAVVTFCAYLPKSPVWKQYGRELQGGVAVPVSLGDKGVVASPLRPVGVAIIAGRPVTVVTEGEFLDAGAEIVVTEIVGDRIVVDPVEVALVSA